ncbi:MAG: single-stranded DNA-binding protein [Ruminococcus sp.]|nr:single-stranded DNA-binding protein [Ruminococcus sp.]MBR1752881.1 single-stranded DNA-binding protein [Ruminococcus sp.]
MINRVVLMGRITNELELRQTTKGLSVLAFTVAVDNGKDKPAFFIDCVAWRQTAEFVNRFFSKGKMIAVEGKLSTRSYEDKNGNKRKITEVVVDNASFTGEPRDTSAQERPQANEPAPSVVIDDLSEFEEVISDDGVPF